MIDETKFYNMITGAEPIPAPVDYSLPPSKYPKPRNWAKEFLADLLTLVKWILIVLGGCIAAGVAVYGLLSITWGAAVIILLVLILIELGKSK